MKSYMIVMAALATAACTTVPDAASVAQAVGRAVTAESAAAARCAIGPRKPIERQAVTAARLLFDARYAKAMSVEQAAQLSAARAATDDACDD